MRFFIAAVLLWASAPAAADWHVASSRHFVIYSEQHPKELTRFATQLEQFDAAVRTVRGMEDVVPSPTARLSVFVVRNQNEVRELADARRSSIAGFYRTQSSGSLAVVPRRFSSGEDDFNERSIFFHEYAHHLMYEQLDQAVPHWLSEGFAELLSTARFDRDGSIFIGTSPGHRRYGIFAADRLSLERMLSGDYEKLTGVEQESIYGRGWLLTHYFTFAEERRGQLADYTSRIARGEAALDAAKAAFGDLRQVERDISRYAVRATLPGLKVALDPASISAISVRRLSDGAAAVMPLRIRSKVGVTEKTAPGVLASVQEVARRYPDDALVQLTLAEAAIDAGYAALAHDAATRAAQLDPRSAEALVFRGRAILELGTDVKAARDSFLAANKLEPEYPEPLLRFYESYVRSGEAPTKNAIAALHYASVLVPGDRNLRLMSAGHYLFDRKLPEARRMLAPLAFDPHAGAMGEVTRKVIALIDSGNVEGALSELKAENSGQPGADQSRSSRSGPAPAPVSASRSLRFRASP